MAVKSPNRDEFYIDVPAMPKPNTVVLSLKPAIILDTFEKLNLYYHWKYMPLTSDEVKSAISSNIHYQNMPVSVTYNNVDVILNQMASLGYLVTGDGQYAPREWVERSGHDIEYLVTFKKLRLWFVTHTYMFTDINSSDVADMIITIKGEHAYVVIYSKTTKFKDLRIYPDVQTFIAFVNSEAMLRFKDILSSTFSAESEIMRMSVLSGQIKLIDADHPELTFIQ